MWAVNTNKAWKKEIKQKYREKQLTYTERSIDLHAVEGKKTKTTHHISF